MNPARRWMLGLEVTLAVASAVIAAAARQPGILLFTAAPAVLAIWDALRA